MVKHSPGKRKIVTLLVLILAGEAIFFLPFVLARIFRPTLLAVFEISNTQLGSFFAVYGIVAMVSYFFGGPFADRFSSRNLITVALLLTSIGGFFMVLLPPINGMFGLYAFWGFSTIFLFWAALIRATREWGSGGFQGRAFGWLEGGRGFTAALIGTFALLVFSQFMPTENDIVFAEGRIRSFKYVIFSIAVITFISGALVWLIVPKFSVDKRNKTITISKIETLLRMPAVWMLSIIIGRVGKGTFTLILSQNRT